MSYPNLLTPEEKLADAKERLNIPTVVVICGSTRFMAEMAEADLRETVAGKIVVKPGCNMKQPHPLWADPVEAEALKLRLDELHRAKIRVADEVLVVGDCIGSSTTAEIAYARSLGKPVRFTHPDVDPSGLPPDRVRTLTGARDLYRATPNPPTHPTQGPHMTNPATDPAVSKTQATTTPNLSPAAQKLLRAIAKYDNGSGVLFRHASSGRFSHPNTLACYNARTFWPLSKANLIAYDNEEAPVRITDAGRQVLAELDAQQAEKKPRPQPSAEGATALRLLREIAKHDEPPLVYDDGLRRVWRVGSRDGHRASIGIWVALEKAGLIRTERVSSIGGHRVSVTEAGRQRLAARPAAPAPAGE